MSKTRSRNFLKSLVERTSFDLATNYVFWSKSPEGITVRDNHRMSDREMALRFCAFEMLSYEEYSQATSLDAFLLDYTRQIDRGSDVSLPSPDIVKLEATFERAMENCAAILDDAAFRRWPRGALRRGPINRAIFESHALALADFKLSTLSPHKEKIKDSFRSLFSDPEYDNAVRSGTGDVRKVRCRLEMPRRILAEILQ